MITVQVSLPTAAYQEYEKAAKRLQRELGLPESKTTPNVVMGFALCQHEAPELCERFHIAMQVIHGERKLPNPVLS